VPVYRLYRNEREEEQTPDKAKTKEQKLIVKVWKKTTALILLIVLWSDFLLFGARRHFLVVGVVAARTFNLCSLFFFCLRSLLLQTYETTIRRDTGANAHIVSLPPSLPFLSSSDAHHPSSPLWFYAFSLTYRTDTHSLYSHFTSKFTFLSPCLFLPPSCLILSFPVLRRALHAPSSISYILFGKLPIPA